LINFFTKNSANFKALLFVFGLFILGGTFWYTQSLVNTLKDKATEYLQFRIKIFESNINNPNADVDVGFFFNEVIKNADYPIIWTDAEKKPQSWLNISETLDTVTALSSRDSLFLKQKLLEMESENPPISIDYQGTILGYYYYGFPPEIQKIKNLPIFTFLLGTVFILFAYLGFTYIKRSEQRNIWVGMAKETAHQLGTPLSAISGWLELIQIDPSQIKIATKEMGNDLLRLKKIANRFSKIGSVPNLKETNITDVINNVVLYFNKRLPNINKRIKIIFDKSTHYTAMVNIDLFEWVLENLIKNGMDSIKKGSGQIEIRIIESSKPPYINIDIEDNGIGIPGSDKKNIFKPGFSTKKRGWGLGLSLAKRIIEDYHQGKLLLLESKIDAGSTFRIKLKKLN
jgi:two-component sensor histidine kinase